MKRLSALLFLGTILGGGIAHAADLYTKAPPAPVPAVMPPLINWNGFYLGGEAGYGWGNFNDTSDSGDNFSVNANGGKWGAFAGVNWVVPNTMFLIGAEIEGLWTNQNTTFTTDPKSTPVVFTTTGKEENIVTGNLRAGITWDRWLFYVAGGAATGFGSATTCASNGGCGPTSNEPGIGWDIGAGFDYLIPWFGNDHIFIGAKFEHVELTGLSDSFGGNDKFTDDIILGRVGWKFGGPTPF